MFPLTNQAKKGPLLPIAGMLDGLFPMTQEPDPEYQVIFPDIFECKDNCLQMNSSGCHEFDQGKRIKIKTTFSASKGAWRWVVERSRNALY
jgi:hypothetical protein